MNEIRKVLGDLLELVRDLRDVHASGGAYHDRIVERIASANNLLASLPADGGAWYPSSMDVSRRADAAYANHDNIIRAAIDLYKERGGQVGGEVVAWQKQYIDPLEGPGIFTDCSEKEYWFFQRPEYENIYKVRELIARQPGAQPAHGPVVGEPVAVVDEGDDGLFVEILFGDDGSSLKCGDKLYSHPATVPAEVIEAAEWLVNELEYFVESPIQGCANTILQYLKSIQGAGYEQG